MPWRIETEHADCPDDSPVAVVKEDDGEVVGCHADEDAAEAQIAALQAEEAGDGDGSEGDDSEAAATREPFEAVLVLEGIRTSDRREISKGALSWRELPLPWMLQTTTPEMPGHGGARVAGRIEQIERLANDVILATGTYDPSDAGREAAQLADSKSVRGVSVDLGDVEAEDVLSEGDDGAPELEATLLTAGRIMGATQTPFPAFEGAMVWLDGNERPDVAGLAEPIAERIKVAAAVTDHPATPEPEFEVEFEDDTGLVASGPCCPQSSWFEDPEFESLTPLTITDDGRIYGHLAPWGECHIGYSDRCVTAPRSSTDYAYFRTGAVRCEDGTEVAVGTITLDTGHENDLRAPADKARAHYDDTGYAAADVAVGEDPYGPWIAGALRPEVTDEQIRKLRGAKLSGDWRPIGRGLELVAILATNTPGYPIARVAYADDEIVGMVAALGPDTPGEPGTIPRWALDLRRDVDRITDAIASLMPAAADVLAHRIRGDRTE